MAFQVARAAYELLFERAVAEPGHTCRLVVRARNPEALVACIEGRRAIDVAGIEVCPSSVVPHGDQEVVMVGTARFVAEAGRLLL